MKRQCALILFVMLVGGDARAEDKPAGREVPDLKVWRVPNVAEGAECYFSPDGKSLIFNGRQKDEKVFHVYTVRIDGSDLKKINDRGFDACSFFRPDGKALVWTSTRDNLDLPPGNYSEPRNYPQGAELYASDLDGGHVVRLTYNKQYDAEVTYAPDGHAILFSRQVDGKIDLWTMKPDGSDQKQITFTPDWQEGGSLYLPDNKTILLRAWKRSEELVQGREMQLFTVKEDGTEFKQITTGPETHWAPYPAPDGVHAIYVKVFPPRNFELVLLNLKTGEERRLTDHPAFDGFPSIAPDGKLLAFSSSRDAAPKTRSLGLYLMDISTLKIGPTGR